jgi:hypothetical protein
MTRDGVHCSGVSLPSCLPSPSSDEGRSASRGRAPGNPRAMFPPRLLGQRCWEARGRRRRPPLSPCLFASAFCSLQVPSLEKEEEARAHRQRKVPGFGDSGVGFVHRGKKCKPWRLLSSVLAMSPLLFSLLPCPFPCLLLLSLFPREKRGLLRVVLVGQEPASRLQCFAVFAEHASAMSRLTLEVCFGRFPFRKQPALPAGLGCMFSHT